jgi:serine/threonine protein kinase
MTVFHAQVAVKMSRSMDLNDGLLHECIALTTLSHPRIVKVLGLLMDTPIPAMLLEYLDGGSLERYGTCLLDCKHSSYPRG